MEKIICGDNKAEALAKKNCAVNVIRKNPTDTRKMDKVDTDVQIVTKTCRGGVGKVPDCAGPDKDCAGDYMRGLDAGADA